MGVMKVSRKMPAVMTSLPRRATTWYRLRALIAIPARKVPTGMLTEKGVITAPQLSSGRPKHLLDKERHVNRHTEQRHKL